MNEMTPVNEPAGAQLWSEAAEPEKIGGLEYRGFSHLVQAIETTYQQKTHVFGHIAPTVGGVWNGDGAIFGGGGAIRSASESVVLVIYRTDDGRENSVELPSSLSLRAGSVFRIDYLNGEMICVTNVSGKQSPRRLLGASAFIPPVPLKKRYVALGLIALGALSSGSFALAAVAAVLPVIYLDRSYSSARQRQAVQSLMDRVMT